jgi:transcriptional regulator with XRE-family HTH domain
MANKATRTREDPRILFGKRVAELRKREGISQESLALESGLARSYLGGVERGQRNIALLNITKLAVALGVPISELFP